MTFVDSARSVGSSAGDLLQAVSRTVGLHPEPWLPPGETLGARLYRHGLDPECGAAWLDTPGEDDARVRLSYALGLTGATSAVSTLSLRVFAGDQTIDLVLAAPRGGRTESSTMLTAVQPYYSTSGVPVMLGARSTGSETFELLCCVEGGEWRAFADLRISPAPIARRAG